MATRRYSPLIFLFALGVVYVNTNTEAIHFPLLISMVSGVAIGFLAPYKGWVLAILQLLFIGIFYIVLRSYYAEWIVNLGIAQFTTIFSVFTILSGSFLGSFIKKTIQSK